MHNHSDDSHEHTHGHNHNHEVNLEAVNMSFIIAVSANLAFTIIEAFYASITNSVSLLGDAGHNLSDVLGLLLAWGSGSLGLAAERRRDLQPRLLLLILTCSLARHGHQGIKVRRHIDTIDVELDAARPLL